MPKKKKMGSYSFKNYFNNMSLQIIYIWFMYKQGFVLNNRRYVMKSNPTKPIPYEKKFQNMIKAKQIESDKTGHFYAY